MTTGDAEKICTRPPWGWKCSREENHEGPCAASPMDPRVSERPTYVGCKTYTDPQPCFSLFKEQVEAINKWAKEHDAARHISEGSTFRYSGAIGGAYTYEFTSTSIGTCVHVRCSCGEEIDVSDYDNW